MKYRVSLLPESRKKQINARNTIAKIRAVSLSVLAVLVAFAVVVVAVGIYANSQLKEVKQLDQQCITEIEKLSSYREIHAALQQRINLFDKIQVKEPALYTFVYEWSQIDHPGVSVDTFDCVSWKTDRLCTISGTCSTRSEYLAYEESLSKIKGVTSVSCVNYQTNVGAGEGSLATFTISVAVSGGTPVVETTVPATTTTTTAAQ
ncbi:MAG: hypothetical protein IJN49_03515 [Clostridia bacterium]|nr:hypothetical protein [Clostridia bacterium]